MENMDMNEIIMNDAVEEATEAVTSSKNGIKTGIKTGLIVGGAMVAGAMLWEQVVKPIGRNWSKGLHQYWQKKALKSKKVKEDVDLEDMEIEDIPEVE